MRVQICHILGHLCQHGFLQLVISGIRLLQLAQAIFDLIFDTNVGVLMHQLCQGVRIPNLVVDEKLEELRIFKLGVFFNLAVQLVKLTAMTIWPYRLFPPAEPLLGRSNARAPTSNS